MSVLEKLIINSLVFFLIFQIAYVMCQYRYFVCPIEYSDALGRMSMDCEPSYLFKPQEISLPAFMLTLTNMVRNENDADSRKNVYRYKSRILHILMYLQLKWKSTITVYPFMLHSLSLSVFSSVIGPFGGFFASGFKRAFKIKVINTFIFNGE